MQECEAALAVRSGHVVVAPNAFKGSMTAVEAAEEIANGLSAGFAAVFGVVPEIRTIPLADGGDGTLETLVAATNGFMFHHDVCGPLGAPVRARWGRLGSGAGDTAIIEMAEASGLRLIRDDERNPRHATSFGTGQLMRAALDAGCTRLVVAIGGSATNDGGAGMAQALGARLLDVDGEDLGPGGARLSALHAIDVNDMHLPAHASVLVACDVDSPLTGPHGASAVYGPQKGADASMVAELDQALAHYASMIRRTLGRDVEHVPGSGAAGGLGAGLLGFCRAELVPGADLVMETTGFERRLAGARFVVTGEGRIDSQTGRGKVVAGVARRARAEGIPVLAIAGSIEPGCEDLLRREGLSAALSMLDGPMTLEAAMRDGRRLIRSAAERAVRIMSLR